MGLLRWGLSGVLAVFPKDRGENAEDGKQPEHVEEEAAFVWVLKLHHYRVSNGLDREESRKRKKERIAGGLPKAQKEQHRHQRSGNDKAEQKRSSAGWLSGLRGVIGSPISGPTAVAPWQSQ